MVRWKIIIINQCFSFWFPIMFSKGIVKSEGMHGCSSNRIKRKCGLSQFVGEVEIDELLLLRRVTKRNNSNFGFWIFFFPVGNEISLKGASFHDLSVQLIIHSWNDCTLHIIFQRFTGHQLMFLFAMYRVTNQHNKIFIVYFSYNDKT